MIPISTTIISPRLIGHSVVRTHECEEHFALDRKWFFSRDKAVQWADSWMDDRWAPCFEEAELS
jgi:hypothetical protein